MEKAAPQSSGASDSLEEELLRLLARQGRRVPVPVFLASIVIAALAYGYVSTWAWAGWLVIVAVMLGLRWAVLGRLTALSRLTVGQRLHIATALSALNGLAHALSTGFFPFIPPFERAVQSMLLISAVAGSVATTAGYLPVFLAYFVPTMGSLVVMWAINPGIPDVGWVEYTTSALMALLGAVFVALARDAFRLFRESFEIRLQQTELNRQLKAALDQAETANRAKTRFLAAASHDLRQPAHALSIFSAVLSERRLDETSKEIVEQMSKAVNALSTQLDALLDISKLDAGIVQPCPTTVPLRELLEQLCDQIRPAAQRKGLAALLECPADGAVHTDSTLLERVLRNLLDNAVKYTDSGYVLLEARREGDVFVVGVADSGRGVPASEQERIFEEFYQLHNPQRDRTQGLGLGLAIVKRLVDLLDIDLRLESAPGRGTRFEFTLPAAAGRVQAPADTGPAQFAADALHVLVIDDEPQIRLAMKALLEGIGCRATLADGAEEALAAAHAGRPDIVLADFRLRGQDGVATVRAIRALHPGLPALLISGDIASDRLREAQAAGIVLLHKPVAAAALKRAIAEAVSR